MTPNRRDFIKFIVAGSVAAGCPVDLALLAAPPAHQAGDSPLPEVDGEHNEVCHQVRDGHHFELPPISGRHDLVIVGGGVSGLTSAYLLGRRDWLLLEKEPHLGGNAYLEEYEGQAFATGAAFVDGSESAALEFAKELGLEMLRVDNPDPSILKGEFIADTWGVGLDHLPYPASVRESFKKFRADVATLAIKGREREIDAQPFSKYMQGYAPEVKLWWDSFGPSNWGARTEETSALLGLTTAKGVAVENYRDGRVTWPGGLGAITRRLAEKLAPTHAAQMLTEAATVHVRSTRDAVEVTYVHEAQLKTVAAKAVIMATPKFITWRLVEGLPAAQVDAMRQIRYIPYPVVNLVFDKPVFNKGYDTWCPGNTFTDFIVADWTVQRNKPDYHQKSNILTFYTPLRQDQRPLLLFEDGARDVASRVLTDFQKLYPGSNVDPVEVHIYRRGHPLYMSTPGLLTRVQPVVRRPAGRIVFANTDSEGPISSTNEGIIAARRAVHEAEQMLASGPLTGARALRTTFVQA
jgi:protoporphyrinogen oxidase